MRKFLASLGITTLLFGGAMTVPLVPHKYKADAAGEFLSWNTPDGFLSENEYGEDETGNYWWVNIPAGNNSLKNVTPTQIVSTVSMVPVFIKIPKTYQFDLTNFIKRDYVGKRYYRIASNDNGIPVRQEITQTEYKSPTPISDLSVSTLETLIKIPVARAASPTITGTVDVGAVVGAQTSLTISHTISTGLQNSAVIVDVGAADSATATYAGTNMDQQINYGANSAFITVLSLANPTTGTQNAVASFASTARAMMQVMTWQDVNQGGVANASSTATHATNSADINVSLTTKTGSSAILFVVANDPKTTSVSFPAGITQQGQISPVGLDQNTSATKDGGLTTPGMTTLTASFSGNTAVDAIGLAIQYATPTPATSNPAITDFINFGF